MTIDTMNETEECQAPSFVAFSFEPLRAAPAGTPAKAQDPVQRSYPWLDSHFGIKSEAMQASPTNTVGTLLVGVGS